MLHLVKNIAQTVYHGFYTFNEYKSQYNFQYDNNNNEMTEKQIHMLIYLPTFSIQLRKSELHEVTKCSSFEVNCRLK